MALRVEMTAPKPRLGSVTITQDGNDIITYSGSGEAIAQSFGSELDAKKHLLDRVQRMQREGYIATSAEEIESSVVERPSSTGADIQKSSEAWTVTFGTTLSGERLKELVAEVRDARLKTVRLACEGQWSPASLWAKAVTGSDFATVERFVFDSPAVTQTRQGKNSVGDLRATFDAMPGLTHAFITGRSGLSPCRHINVRSLYLLGDPLADSLLKGLAGCEFPALEKLVLSVTSDSKPPDQTSIVNAVCQIAAPSLRELSIDGLPDIASVFETLAKSERLAPLRTLALRGTIADEDRFLEVVRASREDYAHLERITLPIEAWLSTPASEELCAVLPACTSGSESVLPSIYESW